VKHLRAETRRFNYNNPMARPAIFLDRDGTINEDVGYVSSPDELVIYPYAARAIRLINETGLKVIIITNQSGVARRLYPETTLAQIHERLRNELARGGAHIDAVYYCPHHPLVGDPPYRQVCECRKPSPGMLHRAARELDIDLQASYVVGDKASDMNLAANAGARGALVLTGYGRETLANRARWPCAPTIIADDLLDAVSQILDRR
jgi:D-glycero-D-manno-heptose 1,7-bisphosphate phosphatase